MDFHLRPAAESDIPAILAIYNHAVLTTTATYDTEPETLDARREWFHDHQAHGFPMLVAERTSDSEVVGWASLGHFRSKSGYRHTVENSLYISEVERGKGLGKLMLSALIDEGRRLGYHVIIAGIDSQAEISIRLHARAGFEQVGYLPEVGYKFGRWLDVVFMELRL